MVLLHDTAASYAFQWLSQAGVDCEEAILLSSSPLLVLVLSSCRRERG